MNLEERTDEQSRGKSIPEEEATLTEAASTQAREGVRVTEVGEDEPGEGERGSRTIKSVYFIPRLGPE